MTVVHVVVPDGIDDPARPRDTAVQLAQGFIHGNSSKSDALGLSLVQLPAMTAVA